jgi:MFS transporter, SET family, sugar efflux transporter
MSSLRYLLFDPSLRAAVAVLILFGAIVCSFAPYLSVLGVQRFHLGDTGYSAFLFLSTVLAVAASVYLGIRADQTARRRPMVLLCGASIAAAMLLMVLAPSPAAFVVAHGVLFPIGSALFGQVFALIRLATNRYPEGERTVILGATRATFAIPFVVVLPLWSLAFGRGMDVMGLYPVVLAMAAVLMIVLLALWPADQGASWNDTPSGLSLLRALAEIANPGHLLRIAALGAVAAAPMVYMSVIGLLLDPSVGRGPQDVALYVGLVAGIEVPFMILLPMLTKGWNRVRLILGGSAIYALHLFFMPFLAGTPLLWVLVLPAAIGGAITLTLPIAYLQDLMANRPGTGASLLSLKTLVGNLMGAACFAIGTALSGYGLVALAGAALSVLGALLLLLADRGRLAPEALRWEGTPKQGGSP